MSTPKATTKIFMNGVTGYIGGAVLNLLLERPDITSYSITVLVRSPEKVQKLREIGVNAVVGSLQDLDIVENLAADADIVIALADADDLPACEATLRGLKRRHESTGTVPHFIHTSGTGVLADDARGEFATDVVYDDLDIPQIESLPQTQLHRNVDLKIVAADQAGYVKTYIVLPSTIYGIAKGRLVELGIQNPHSIQVPYIVRASLDRGRAGMVGQGKNLWPNVHIDDIAELYITLFNSIRTDPTTPHGRNGFYFGESGEHRLYDVSLGIGKALVALGKSDKAEPTTFTQDDLNKYFGGSPYLGSNSRCKANRARSLGWAPKYTTANLIDSLPAEVAAWSK